KRAGPPPDLRLQAEVTAEFQGNEHVQEAGELSGGARDSEGHSNAGLGGVHLARGRRSADAQDPQRNSDGSHDCLAAEVRGGVRTSPKPPPPVARKPRAAAHRLTRGLGAPPSPPAECPASAPRRRPARRAATPRTRPATRPACS